MKSVKAAKTTNVEESVALTPAKVPESADQALTHLIKTHPESEIEPIDDKLHEVKVLIKKYKAPM